MEELLVKKIGIFISILIFILFIINLVNNNVYIIMLFVSIMFFISSFFLAGKFIQVGCLYLSSIITIFINSDISCSVTQVVLLIILSEKYGFFKKHLVYKIVLSSLLFSSLSIFHYFSSPRPISNVVTTILFAFIFMSFIYFIKKDDTKICNDIEKDLKEKIKKLNFSINEKDMIIHNIRMEFVDPVDAGLTNAELILLKNLCLYHESNLDLSNRLNKSEYTIKNQLKKILLKIGVEDRHQLIDVCKNYYLIPNK